jgi:hypothetical protein
MLPILIALAILSYHLIRGDGHGFATALFQMIFGFIVVTILYAIF